MPQWWLNLVTLPLVMLINLGSNFLPGLIDNHRVSQQLSFLVFIIFLAKNECLEFQKLYLSVLTSPSKNVFGKLIKARLY